MQFHTFILIVVLQLIAPALADFYVYMGHTNKGHHHVIWAFHQIHPTCGHVQATMFYRGTEDVSGDKKGVVCDGWGCSLSSPDPQTIERLEMNTDFGHYTFYKFRDYNLVDLNGKIVGKCKPISMDDHKYDCPVNSDTRVIMSTRLWCEGNIWPPIFQSP